MKTLCQKIKTIVFYKKLPQLQQNELNVHYYQLGYQLILGPFYFQFVSSLNYIVLLYFTKQANHLPTISSCDFEKDYLEIETPCGRMFYTYFNFQRFSIK